MNARTARENFSSALSGSPYPRSLRSQRERPLELRIAPLRVGELGRDRDVRLDPLPFQTLAVHPDVVDREEEQRAV